MTVLPPLAAQMGKLRSGERAWLVQRYLARKGLIKRPGRRGGVVPGGLGVKDEVAVRPPERTRPGALREPGGTEPRGTRGARGGCSSRGGPLREGKGMGKASAARPPQSMQTVERAVREADPG